MNKRTNKRRMLIEAIIDGVFAVGAILICIAATLYIGFQIAIRLS